MRRFYVPFEFGLVKLHGATPRNIIVKISQRELDKNNDHALLLGEKVIEALEALDAVPARE